MKSELGFQYRFYEAITKRLIQTNGLFSVVLRESPFDGPFTSQNWYDRWNSIPHTEFVVEEWLGATRSYTVVRDGVVGETKPGINRLRVYEARKAILMLKSVNSVFDWQPPFPDDFAAYTSSGEVICLSISHEEQLLFPSAIWEEDWCEPYL